MQTVVTGYYGIILDDTVNLLNEFENGNVKSKDLWTSMIHSLQKSFRYDLDQDGISLSNLSNFSILVISVTIR